MKIINLLYGTITPRKFFLLPYGAKVNSLAKAVLGVFGIIRKHLKERKCINAQVFAGSFVLSVTGPLILFFLSCAAVKCTAANLEIGN